jgi:hypothetical protein
VQCKIQSNEAKNIDLRRLILHLIQENIIYSIKHKREQERERAKAIYRDWIDLLLKFQT